MLKLCEPHRIKSDRVLLPVLERERKHLRESVGEARVACPIGGSQFVDFHNLPLPPCCQNRGKLIPLRLPILIHGRSLLTTSPQHFTLLPRRPVSLTALARAHIYFNKQTAPSLPYLARPQISTHLHHSHHGRQGIHLLRRLGAQH